jgi:hypothetical protein
MTPVERKRLWQQHITDWQASGLSGMAYCQQQSLTYCRFVYWRKKLAEPDQVPERPVRSGTGRSCACRPECWFWGVDIPPECP